MQVIGAKIFKNRGFRLSQNIVLVPYCPSQFGVQSTGGRRLPCDSWRRTMYVADHGFEALHPLCGRLRLTRH